MAQSYYCPGCAAAFGVELRGRSCPACGEELIHGRVPAGRTTPRRVSPGGTGRAVWDHIVKRDPCAYCSTKLTPKEITIDHIVPKALGGSKGSWTNRTAACRPCNGGKAHTPLLFYMLERVGMDLNHHKDEEGNWPIPETPEERAERLAHELDADGDPRRLLSQITQAINTPCAV